MSEVIKAIGIDRLAELLEGTVIEQTVNIGMAIAHYGCHPDFGNIVLIGTTSVENLFIQM